MLLTMQRAILHRFIVTQTDARSEDCLMLDQEILDLAGILPYEQVQVANTNNGERFTLHVVAAGRGSGICSLHGPAARKAQPGDQLTITAHALLVLKEAYDLIPTVVAADERNRPSVLVDTTVNDFWSEIMEIEGY